MRESESEDEYFSDAFESHERNETNSPQPSESQTLEPDVDPLRIRKENEDRMTQEERDVNHDSFSSSLLFTHISKLLF